MIDCSDDFKFDKTKKLNYNKSHILQKYKHIDALSRLSFRFLCFFIFPLSFMLLFSGCSNTRYLSEGELLHTRNQVQIERGTEVENRRELRREMNDIATPKPNQRFLGLLRLRLKIYNLASRRKENRFRWWVKNNLGEAPVLYDSIRVARSRDMMQNYLRNKGHFYGDITYDVDSSNQRVTVRYKVEPAELYTIGEVHFPQSPAPLAGYVRTKMDETLLESGAPFDVTILQRERARIAYLLRDEGYFYFNREFVSFDLDSTGKNRQVDIYLRINEPLNEGEQHRKLDIRNIYVYTDHSPDRATRVPQFDTIQKGAYYFIFENNYIRPATLMRSIMITPGTHYRITDYENSLSQLSNLGTFRFVNIRYQEVAGSDGRQLDALIYLTPAKRQDMSVEAELSTHSETMIGSGLSYPYRNINVFRGAEIFTLNVSAGVDTDLSPRTPLVNTTDVNAEVGLLVPKFMVPFGIERLYRGFKPKTRFSARYSFLNRYDFYTVHSSNFLFGYEWRGRNRQRSHAFYPISFNLINFDNENANPAFIEILERSPILRASFSNQVILGMNYSMVWNTQTADRDADFFFFRWNFDLAGNTLNGANSLYAQFDEDADAERIFGIRYSQYAKTDGDFRYYFSTGSGSRLVTRFAAGIGVPYGNSEVLPYVKQFFSGGPNFNRAWRVRGLGPGGYNPETDNTEESEFRQIFFDQTGDLKLEANIEYRFDIISFVKGALFLDAGNVWLLEKDSLRPFAEFQPDRFHREIALGAGAGVRLDFNYFVIRFDMGFPLRDPADRNNPWRMSDIQLGSSRWRSDNLNFNLAIGYPF